MYLYFIVLIFVQSVFSQECSIQGKCINSDAISIIKVTSVEECLVMCATTSNCKFSTFDAAHQECSKFINCNEIDNNEAECRTNKKECVNSKLNIINCMSILVKYHFIDYSVVSNCCIGANKRTGYLHRTF